MTVLELDHGLPHRVRVRFDHDPEGGSYTFLAWRNRQLVRFELPEVGQSVELKWSPGDMSL